MSHGIFSTEVLPIPPLHLMHSIPTNGAKINLCGDFFMLQFVYRFTKNHWLKNTLMAQFQNDSIFWVEIEKIRPNPYQPRRDFDQQRLNDLAESIRQYGVLQPLVVTRYEVTRDDGGLAAEYELIAGERRLRASKIAGVFQVPVIIRSGEESDRMKLELAIIENLQREDLNPVDRARAFERLANEFGFSHAQVGRKIGKSREYVSNSIRILMLPEPMRQALSEGKITEGHTRPLLMLGDREDEQTTLFKEIVYKQITVREAESIARKIATEKARKRNDELKPEILELEGNLSESLGTRVHIEQRDVGGKIIIDYFSDEDLRMISELIAENKLRRDPNALLEKYIRENAQAEAPTGSLSESEQAILPESVVFDQEESAPQAGVGVAVIVPDARDENEPEALLAPEALSNPVETTGVQRIAQSEGEDIYSVKHFSI